MATTNLTPGPWSVDTFVDNRPNGSDHHTYRITPQRGVYGSMFEDDARLAAAAPDLLAELDVRSGDLHMLKRAIEEGDPKAELMFRVEDMLRETRAALAKATASQA